MTQENLNKIAKRYAQDELKDNHASVEDIVAAAFLDGIDYAEHHLRWISVEDALPEEDGKYLFFSTRGGVQCAYYYKGLTMGRTVTHWMPLPQPPSSSEFPNNFKKGGEQ